MNPPAFQFYADDFLAGTADMTAEEVGVYMRLLCHAWNKKGIENDEKRIGILAGLCHGNATACAVDVLRRKFVLGPDNIWRNERQEKIRANQEEYRKTQSNKAHLRWEKAKSGEPNGHSNGHAGAYATAMPVHMPKPCSPSPSPTPSPMNIERERAPAFAEAVVPTWEEVKDWAAMDGVPEEVAQAFFDHYQANNLWANKHGFPVNVRGSLKVWFNRNQTIKTNGNGAPAATAKHPRQMWQLLQDEKALKTRLQAEEEANRPKPELIESLKAQLRAVRKEMTLAKPTTP